jgi:hypothetical protein
MQGQFSAAVLPAKLLEESHEVGYVDGIQLGEQGWVEMIVAMAGTNVAPTNGPTVESVRFVSSGFCPPIPKILVCAGNTAVIEPLDVGLLMVV